MAPGATPWRRRFGADIDVHDWLVRGRGSSHRLLLQPVPQVAGREGDDGVLLAGASTPGGGGQRGNAPPPTFGQGGQGWATKWMKTIKNRDQTDKKR